MARLAIISPSGEDSGAERYLRIIVAAARERDWEVQVGLPPIAALDRLRADLHTVGAEVGDLDVGRPRGPGKHGALWSVAADWRAARGWLKQARPDRILVILPHPEQSPGALLATVRRGVPNVASVQLVPDDLSISENRRRMYRLFQRLGQTWLTLSQDNRRRLAAALGCPVGRLAMVYNAAWNDRPAPVHERPRLRAELRRELGLSPDARLILSVGRLNRQKGYDLAARAVPLVAARHDDVQFLWAGDGEERSALIDVLSASGSTAHVQLLGRRDDIGRLLAGADLFLLASRYEGFPLAPLEAMNAGLPVIVNSAGPLPEVVRHEVDGLVVDCSDPEGLAGAIGWALGHRDAMTGMADSARARVLREFSRANMTEQTLALLEPVTPDGRRPGGRSARRRPGSGRRPRPS